MSDTTTTTTASLCRPRRLPPQPEMGTFDEAGEYTPRQVVADDLDGTSLEDAIAGTIVEFEDGDIVSGTVVKVDKDEVLLDIGFKSEGVIPARELSIRHDVDPHEIVTLGDRIEALVLQKEDKEGRLILSKKRAQYERAWGTIEEIKERDGVVSGPVIEVVKGGLILDIGLRGFLPASLVELRRVRDLQPYVGRTPRRQDHRAGQEPQQRGPVPAGLAGGDPEGAARRVPDQPEAGRGAPRRGVVGRQLRCLRRPGRHGRPDPRVGAVLEAHRPSVVGRGRRRRGRGPGARRRHGPRADQPVAQGHPVRPVAGVRQRPPGGRAGLRPGHQAGAVRRLRAGRRGHRGSGAHLRDGQPPRRPARAGRQPRARSCGSRSSRSTCSAGGSACRSSRPPRAARWRPSTARPSASTPTTSRATTSAPPASPASSRSPRPRRPGPSTSRAAVTPRAQDEGSAEAATESAEDSYGS